MSHPSLTRDLPREIDGERWVFSLPPSSPRRPLHASIRSSVLKEIEREIEGKVALLGGDGLPSTRPEKRKTLVGRKVFGRVMNLQIPWNGACYSLVAAVASARNRTPISLSLSLCPRLSTQPPPLLLPLGCVMEIAFARRGEEGRAWPVLQSNGGSARNYYWANCILTNSKGVRV